MGERQRVVLERQFQRILLGYCPGRRPTGEELQCIVLQRRAREQLQLD